MERDMLRKSLTHLFSGSSGILAQSALCFAVLLSSPALSQLSMTVAGTLTCTVADAPADSNATVKLSCNFRTHSGLNADYVGVGKTRTDGVPVAKHVFVWSVVAIGGRDAPLLDGTYNAGPSQQGAAVLVGGEDGSLRLEPVTNTGQVPGPSEITVLTLKAATTKT